MNTDALMKSIFVGKDKPLREEILCGRRAFFCFNSTTAITLKLCACCYRSLTKNTQRNTAGNVTVVERSGLPSSERKLVTMQITGTFYAPSIGCTTNGFASR